MILPMLSVLGDTETVNPLKCLAAAQEEGESTEEADGFAALLAALGEMDTPEQTSMAATMGVPLEKGINELPTTELSGLHDAVPPQDDQVLADLSDELQGLLQTLAAATPGEEIPSSVQQQLESLNTRIGQWLEQSPSSALAEMQNLVQTLGDGLAEIQAAGAQLPAEVGSLLSRLLGPGISANLQGQGQDSGGKQLPQTAMGLGSLAAAPVASDPAPLDELARSDLKPSSGQEVLQEAGSARDPSLLKLKNADGNVSFQLKSLAAGDVENPSSQTDIDIDGLINMPETTRLSANAAVLQQTIGTGSSMPPVTAAGQIAGVQTGASVQTGATTLPQLPPIVTSPGESAWSQALGERVLWMAGRDIQRAEIRLNPPQLGPVEIRISMHNDQASVSLVAQHPFTRDALEASIPRLREMLGESNIDLADVDVGQRDTRESSPGQDNRERGSGEGGGNWLAEAEAPDGDHSETLMRTRAGLVDDFA